MGVSPLKAYSVILKSSLGDAYGISETIVKAIPLTMAAIAVMLSFTMLIWNIGATLEQLSSAWELQPGDLVFTGTPEGVGAVQRGDLLEGGIEGLGSLRVQID